MGLEQLNVISVPIATSRTIQWFIHRRCYAKLWRSKHGDVSKLRMFKARAKLGRKTWI